MNCRFTEKLTALKDGELSESEARALEAHLAGCAECQIAGRTLARTLGTLRSLQPAPVEPPNTARLLARLAREEATVSSVPLWTRRWLPAVGIAAIAALALVVSGHLQSERRPQAGPVVGAAPEGLAIATDYELLKDFEVVGMEQPEDVELVAQLDTLERQ